MLGREDTGAVLGSGAVDAEFWALICEDEEWLDSEFDELVSDAWEIPTRLNRGRIGNDQAPGEWMSSTWRVCESSLLCRSGIALVPRWRRERGPPPEAHTG